MKLVPSKAAFWFLCALYISAVQAYCLDREAFSIQHYDLDVRIEPEQHRLAARGTVLLRNDSATPQRIVILQVSSSLDWRLIKLGDKPLQFIRQPLTSDIDHTGSLSEAIVTLPQEVPPHASVGLEIAYEGVVLLDTTRLTRIGAPEESARSTDWDQIDSAFSGVRGIGHVAWYPVATDVANLSEGDSLFQVLERWKARETGATARIRIGAWGHSDVLPPRLLANEPSCASVNDPQETQLSQQDCNFSSLGTIVPSFVLGQYGEVDRSSIRVFNVGGHAAAAEVYANAAEKAAPLVTDWFGPAREKALTVDIPDPDATPFESGAFRMTSLQASDPKLVGLAATHQLTHASFTSFRTWINEGLAHFAQAVYLEQEKGRQAALDYLEAHRAPLHAAKASDPAIPDSGADNTLVTGTNEELIRSKAMCVWWMVRDMVGDAALKKAIAAYKPEEDKDPSYMPRLIAGQTQRDLAWFFDDWVYHDRGLPDFKVESVFARSASPNLYVLTITLENTGPAGAEVPVRIRMAKGETIKRIEVRAKSKTTVRVETPAAPREIVVNDGSVPESETKDNVFKVAAPQS